MKILLVDDDAFLRDMYATKFTEAGHEVETAESAADALRQLQSEGGFEVLLLDIVMPGMTGIEMLKKIKADMPQLAIKSVVLSNQGEKTDIQEALDAGALGYIVKAESIPSEVVEKVTDLCAAK